MGPCNAKGKTEQQSNTISKQQKDQPEVIQSNGSQHLNTGQVEQQTLYNQQINVSDFVYQQQGSTITQDYSLLLPRIGKGAYGEVRKAINKKTSFVCAVKIQKKPYQSQSEKNQLINEVNILKTLDNPNIIKIYAFYEDANSFYIVQDLCDGGELFDRIIENKSFTEKQACDIIFQVLKAINYLHDKKIVHGDLKPENILFDNKQSNQIKIIDFGTSQMFDPNQKLSKKLGTPYYIAPEVLKKQYDQKCDIWSIGVILYILLSGCPPFNGGSDDEIMIKVGIGKYDFSGAQWNDVSDEAKNLIKKMICVDVKQRWDAQQCLGHKWIIQNQNRQEVNTQVLKNALSNLQSFRVSQKLQQGIYLFVVNNLTSKEEKKELDDTFAQLDSNHDGKLSKEELIEGYKKTMNIAQAQEEVNRIMDQVDLDKSGFLDYSEFVMATVNKQKALSVERLESAFKMFDKDESGKISFDEIKNMFGRTKKLDEKIWNEFTNQFDENKDGEISLQEFKQMMLALLK